MIDSVNAISTNPVLAAIAANALQIRAIADLSASFIAQSSDTVTVSQAATDLADALNTQNTDDFTRQLAKAADQAATETAVAQDQVQANDQLSLDTVVQSLDTATDSEVEDNLANDLQLQKDRDYAQLLADIANLTATEEVATQNMEIDSAVYSMASANSFRQRRISLKDLKI
jgi:hypothetical protein